MLTHKVAVNYETIVTTKQSELPMNKQDDVIFFSFSFSSPSTFFSSAICVVVSRRPNFCGGDDLTRLFFRWILTNYVML
jgi:hypothetical protein